MLDIKPFKGTRPFNEEAENIIAPSTDYLSEEGIIDVFEKNYWNYLKILNPVGKTKETSQLEAAKKHFSKMKENHIIKQDIKPFYYVYKIQTSNHVQLGFLAVANINLYINNKIKGHELTYKERTNERANQMLNLDTQIGPIYVAYQNNNKLDDFLFQLSLTIPEYDFLSFDKSRHSLWCVSDKFDITNLTNIISELNSLYIADGHHRIEAMKEISKQKTLKNTNHTGKENYNYFMIAAFPKDQSKIFDYNRVVKNLNGLNVNEFISKISQSFYCKSSDIPVRPKKIRNFGMFHEKKWYLLEFKNENLLEDDILSKLDINIIDKFCLKNILGIKDANKDDRIRFIAGCHGLEALEKKVNENPDSVAFSIFPTQIDDVIKIADKKLTMPPKSTWFDPKPLDGLVVYEFGNNK